MNAAFFRDSFESPLWMAKIMLQFSFLKTIWLPFPLLFLNPIFRRIFSMSLYFVFVGFSLNFSQIFSNCVIVALF